MIDFLLIFVYNKTINQLKEVLLLCIVDYNRKRAVFSQKEIFGKDRKKGLRRLIFAP